jgi:hypothetical protein
MNVELDIEKKLQALVAKDRIRIKEFFIDFDKLRKGYVGEAAVSFLLNKKRLFIGYILINLKYDTNLFAIFSFAHASVH